MQPYFLQYLIIPEKTKNAIDFTKETQSRSRNAFQTRSRACLKKAFCKMCVTICGRCCPDEGVVAGYDNRIRVKYTAKWGVQIAGMIFQTRSGIMEMIFNNFPKFSFCQLLPQFLSGHSSLHCPLNFPRNQQKNGTASSSL